VTEQEVSVGDTGVSLITALQHYKHSSAVRLARDLVDLTRYMTV